MGRLFLAIGYSREDVIVLLPSPSGPTKFRSTVMSPYVVEDFPYNSKSSNLASLLVVHVPISGRIHADDTNSSKKSDNISILNDQIFPSVHEFASNA